jgi:hypothetical protein
MASEHGETAWAVLYDCCNGEARVKTFFGDVPVFTTRKGSMDWIRQVRGLVSRNARLRPVRVRITVEDE